MNNLRIIDMNTFFKAVTAIFLMGIVIALTSCNNNKNRNNMETSVPKISNFPVGDENTGYAQYFSGRSWLALLTSNKDLNVPMFNVTFEPGCRNNWHSHTGGRF